MLKLCLILSLSLIQTNAFGTMGDGAKRGFNKCNFDYECKPNEYCVVDPNDRSLQYYHG